MTSCLTENASEKKQSAKKTSFPCFFPFLAQTPMSKNNKKPISHTFFFFVLHLDKPGDRSWKKQVRHLLTKGRNYPKR